jgi:hypothetical protein
MFQHRILNESIGLGTRKLNDPSVVLYLKKLCVRVFEPRKYFVLPAKKKLPIKINSKSGFTNLFHLSEKREIPFLLFPNIFQIRHITF